MRRRRTSPFWITLIPMMCLALTLVLVGCGEETPTAPTPTPETFPPTFTPTATLTPKPSPTLTPAALLPEVSNNAGGEASATVPPQATPTGTRTPAAAGTPAQGSTGVRWLESPEYGMQVFLWWRPEVADRDLQLVRDAGFGWVKQVFPWREIEGAAKGAFNWQYADRVVDQVEQYGLKLLVRVDSQPAWAGGGYPDNGPPDNMQDFADFLTALATRYKGRVDAYEIWNEPNLNVPGRTEWGGRPPNPAEYTEMLKVAYQAIKAVDPEAIVISAGLAPTSRWDDVAMSDLEFLRGMYEAGAAPYFDMLGAHGAGYKAPPEMDPAEVARNPLYNNNDPSPEERKRIYCFRHVEDLRQVMVENGDADKQVALVEFGWTIDPRPDSPYAWHAVDAFQQGEYLVRAYQYARENWSPWIGIMSLIYLQNVDWTPDKEEYWWSIIEPAYPELKLRPAYVMLKEMPK